MVAGLFCVMALNLAFGATSAIQPGTVVYFVVMYTQPENSYVSHLSPCSSISVCA